MNRKLILKSPRFVPFGINLTQFGANTYITDMTLCEREKKTQRMIQWNKHK